MAEVVTAGSQVVVRDLQPEVIVAAAAVLVVVQEREERACGGVDRDVDAVRERAALDSGFLFVMETVTVAVPTRGTWQHQSGQR